MAAITLPGTLHLPDAHRRPALVALPPVAVPPVLRRHRRVLALVAVALVAFAAQFLLTAALRAAAPAVQPAPAPAAVAPVAAATGGEVIVVQAGDTLWGIAERLAPDADTRAVVDALVARNGGSTALVAGQSLDVSGIAA